MYVNTLKRTLIYKLFRNLKLKKNNKQVILKEFQRIPGVGKSIANDLWNLGYRSIGELRKKNPEKLYDDFVLKVGRPVDRCMLYVFRCAVYLASHKTHEPRLLKWWNWK